MVKVQRAGRAGWGTLIALVVLVGLAGFSATACGDESGTTPSPLPSASASASGVPSASSLLLWKFKTGDRVTAAPVVADGAVFVGSSDGYLHAVDVQSGQERWKVLTGDTPSGCSPVVANGAVYVASSDGYLHAFDLRSGEERWTREVGWWSGYATPATLGGAVYMVGHDGRLRAVDGRTGRTLWAAQTGGSGTENSRAASGRKVYLGGGRGLEAYDAATGKKLWTYRPWGQGVYRDLVVSGGMVYGRTGGFIQAVWAADARTGRGGWSLPSDWPAASPPAVSGGVAYFTGGFSADDNRQLRVVNVRAVDARSGEDLWASETGWDDSLLAASGIVVCVVGGKELFAMDARTGRDSWQFETGGWISAAPAVWNGVVYVGSSDGFLYAIGSRPAATYAEAPEAGAYRHKIGGTGTVGWSFQPSDGISVTHLGCFSPEPGGLEFSHRVGIFDANGERLLGAVTVRRTSPLEGYFRWEPLRRPLVLKAGHTYLIGTHTLGDETLYEEGLPTEQWAPEVVLGELVTSYGRSGGRFMAPTDPTPGAGWEKVVWMSPNFKFVPVTAASLSPSAGS